MGGLLAHPQDSWPGLFAPSFWREYPYFLPCAVAAFFVVLAYFMLFFFLEEVLGLKNPYRTLLTIGRHYQPSVGRKRHQLPLASQVEMTLTIEKRLRKNLWRIYPCDLCLHLPLLSQSQTTPCSLFLTFRSGLWPRCSCPHLCILVVLILPLPLLVYGSRCWELWMGSYRPYSLPKLSIGSAQNVYSVWQCRASHQPCLYFQSCRGLYTQGR